MSMTGIEKTVVVGIVLSILTPLVAIAGIIALAWYAIEKFTQ